MSEISLAESSDGRRTRIDGTFYRVVAAPAVSPLDGARSPEGRFHRDSQRALYLSPSVAAAVRATDRYRRSGDAPRVAIRLLVTGAVVVALRAAGHRAALAIDPRDSLAEWWLERRAGRPATSWQASDAVRASGADGMIYPSRSCAERWHLVLFRWNTGEGAVVARAGTPLAVAGDADRRASA